MCRGGGGRGRGGDGVDCMCRGGVGGGGGGGVLRGLFSVTKKMLIGCKKIKS